MNVLTPTLVGIILFDNLTFCVVKGSYSGLCNVLCREGLQSSAVYLGSFPR